VYLTGLVKYVIKTLLTVIGFISMYIFSGGIRAILDDLSHLLTERNVLEAVVVSLVSKYLPPTSLKEVLIQTVIGSLTAGILWF